MLIMNHENRQSLSSVDLYVTKDEARQIIEYLEGMLADDNLHHVHVYSRDYSVTASFTVYSSDNLNSYPHAVRAALGETLK